MKRVFLATAALSVLAFWVAAGGLGASGITPARAILSMTAEAPFQAPQPATLTDDWFVVVLGLVAVCAVGFGLYVLRQAAPPPTEVP